MFSLQHLGIKTIWAARLINGAFREIGTYEQITGAMPLRDGAKAFRAAVKSMVNVQDGLFIPVIRTSDSAMMRRRQKAWAQVDQCEYRRGRQARSEEHTSELQSLMRNSYTVLCLKK